MTHICNEEEEVGRYWMALGKGEYNLIGSGKL
jgi:hypothetical protein